MKVVVMATNSKFQGVLQLPSPTYLSHLCPFGHPTPHYPYCSLGNLCQLLSPAADKVHLAWPFVRQLLASQGLPKAVHGLLKALHPEILCRNKAAVPGKPRLDMPQQQQEKGESKGQFWRQTRWGPKQPKRLWDKHGRSWSRAESVTWLKGLQIIIQDLLKL